MKNISMLRSNNAVRMIYVGEAEAPRLLNILQGSIVTSYGGSC